MYADDTTIYFNTEDFPKDNLAKHFTTELHKVDVWLKHNKLSLNVFSHLSEKNGTVTTLNIWKTYRTCEIL